MVEMDERPEINQQIATAVERLSSEFSLSGRAQRLLHLYFEIIFYERPKDQAETPVQPADVEEFMRKVANVIFRRESHERMPLSFRRLLRYYGLRSRSSHEAEVTAADLLHIYEFLRGGHSALVRYPFALKWPHDEVISSIFPDDFEQTALFGFILDKD